ncbi:hypothetical protein FA13DRAFT_157901 [Coprinellus micaceus]|uniref:Uncharacterized protein n=1 Tax=Coprinellus micaceus TaxID=71717 RepID=A0A4Y7TH57_COPMI|nr:hypothetical protein FA13DRAFT_157901 [Coprinellus micaceus]
MLHAIVPLVAPASTNIQRQLEAGGLSQNPLEIKVNSNPASPHHMFSRISPQPSFSPKRTLHGQPVIKHTHRRQLQWKVRRSEMGVNTCTQAVATRTRFGDKSAISPPPKSDELIPIDPPV